MPDDHITRATITVKAPVEKVWTALVTPATIKKFMFGSTVASDFREGSRITWSGEWQDRPYEDKGKILEVERNRVLRYSHFSPLSGLPDVPENYHTVRIELSGAGQHTTVTLAQDNNPTEQARDHSQENWEAMLTSLKSVVEGS